MPPPRRELTLSENQLLTFPKSPFLIRSAMPQAVSPLDGRGTRCTSTWWAPRPADGQHPPGPREEDSTGPPRLW